MTKHVILLGGESKENAQNGLLVLDTKYYTARICLILLKNVEEAECWNGFSNLNINAAIYRFDGDFENLKRFVELMKQHITEIQVCISSVTFCPNKMRNMET